MGVNRRNYYRILHVQPEAPGQVIFASYRTAQLRDLSMTGVSITTDLKIERQQVIRIIRPLFDILATVVGCRGDGRRVEVHASLLNAIFMKQKGVVVSVKT